MTRRSPLAGAALAIVLLAAACGGGDDAGVAGATTIAAPAPTDVASTEVPPGAAPSATVSADLPDEIRAETGPVEVVGDALPPLGGAEPAADPAVGMTAPVLVGEDYDGNIVRVDAATEGPTMVVFLAHWCPHCNNEIPRLNELRDEGAFPEDLNIVAVSTALNPGQPNFPPSQWLVDKDWTFPVIADGIEVDVEPPFIGARMYGVDGFPFTTLIGADGTVAARWSGEREPEQVLAALDEYLGLS
jgi:cytochrome c biogenesis protein CcmG, thiol:disulfide interchange protein DsbE